MKDLADMKDALAPSVKQSLDYLSNQEPERLRDIFY